jgi:sugar-specific transcriptional regulator TrmB
MTTGYKQALDKAHKRIALLGLLFKYHNDQGIEALFYLLETNAILSGQTDWAHERADEIEKQFKRVLAQEEALKGEINSLVFRDWESQEECMAAIAKAKKTYTMAKAERERLFIVADDYSRLASLVADFEAE